MDLTLNLEPYRRNVIKPGTFSKPGAEPGAKPGVIDQELNLEPGEPRAEYKVGPGTWN